MKWSLSYNLIAYFGDVGEDCLVEVVFLLLAQLYPLLQGRLLPLVYVDSGLQVCQQVVVRGDRLILAPPFARGQGLHQR